MAAEGNFARLLRMLIVVVTAGRVVVLPSVLLDQFFQITSFHLRADFILVGYYVFGFAYWLDLDEGVGWASAG